jgi:predicted Zn finger-like uncharacterized protein
LEKHRGVSRGQPLGAAMTQSVLCPSCASRLRIPEQALGKRVRCPKCSNAFLADKQDEGPVDSVPEARPARPPLSTALRQAKADEALSRPKADPDDDYELVPVARAKPRGEEAEEPEEGLEPVDMSDEAPAEKPKKKKRKKKRRRPHDDESESPAWPWLVFGGSAAFLLLSFLFLLTVLLDWDNPVKFVAAYLLIGIPVSTVIFFFAMFLSSVLVGAVEIGEIHVAVVKAFGLMVIVELVSLLPLGIYASYCLSFVVSVIGLVLLFRLDIWEARIIVGINFILNLCLYLALMGVLHTIMTHAEKAGDVGGNRPVQPSPAVHKQGWDEEDVFDHDGDVEYDRKHEDDAIVIGISFRDTHITDADLAHMKDFPRLTKLDLTNTSITDKGLAHLKGCKNLQVLILTRTKVSKEGVEELKQELPRLQVVR